MAPTGRHTERYAFFIAFSTRLINERVHILYVRHIENPPESLSSSQTQDGFDSLVCTRCHTQGTLLAQGGTVRTTTVITNHLFQRERAETTCTWCMCTGPRQGSPRCTLASPPPRHTSLQTIVTINQYPCYPLTIMVTQGEYLGESFPETDGSTSLEEGAHLLGEPFPLSVQEDAHTWLPTSPSSSHLCVIKIFNIFKELAP